MFNIADFIVVRYADDLMLYARNDTDLATTVECLVQELAAVGSNLNTSKTKNFDNSKFE